MSSMKTKLAAAGLLVFLAVNLGGCLRSLHPFYSDKTLIFDHHLIGTWVDKDTSAWTFVQTNEKAYELIYTEKGSPGRFEARLIKLGKYTFLDLFPKEPVMQNGFYKFHLLPVHTIMQMWIEEKKIRMAMLNNDWFKEQVDKKKVKLAHEHRGNEIILTASTEDLQKFVLKHVNDPKAFPEPSELRRLK